MTVRYLSRGEVVELHRLVVALESAVAQPRATFAGTEKAAALGYSLALNHPFIDGNKRVAHAALETFLVLNGRELEAGVDDAERTILALAAGALTREQFVAWVTRHLVSSGA